MTNSIIKYRWLLMSVNIDRPESLKISGYMRKKDMKRDMKHIQGEKVIYKKQDYIRAKNGDVVLHYEPEFMEEIK